MGPYSEQRQLMRAMAVTQLLEQDLSPWARNYWQTVLARLARNETVYNWRVKQTYANMESKIYE